MAARKETPIARLEAAEKAEFRAEFRLRRPVVLRGGMKKWPDTLFDMGRLADRLGAEPVLTYRLPAKAPALRMSSIKRNFYFWSDQGRKRKHLRRWTFGEFLNALRDGGAHYCMANGTKNRKLRDLLAAEAGDFACDPGRGTRGETARREFFIGSRNTGPGLHHDGAVESFLCQLIGTKRVNVFSPADIAWLYATGPWHAPMSHFSAVADSFHPDLHRFPLFGKATVHSCRLKPGEVLYLPPHWYHDPCAEEPGAMMTIRNVPPPDIWGTAKERGRLAHAAASLHETLRNFPPAARAIYAALLAHDLDSGRRKKKRR